MPPPSRRGRGSPGERAGTKRCRGGPWLRWVRSVSSTSLRRTEGPPRRTSPTEPETLRFFARRFLRLELPERDRAADLVRDDQERLVGGAARGSDEGHDLWTAVR